MGALYGTELRDGGEGDMSDGMHLHDRPGELQTYANREEGGVYFL